MDELTKIDLIRNRLDVSYAEAHAALEKHEGDVVAALIELEEKAGHRHGWRCMKDMIAKWGAAKIHVKKKGETVLSVPLPVGLAALAGIMANDDLALAAGFGVALGMMKGYHIDLENEPEEEKEFVIIS
ncbi:MAG TPA: DUF4342 domain-containing protein [Clostridia bacterium]|nr:DUF4342 domain-containing protein [Clostridia bacterium]